ncbi:MAG: GNAT family N-acetyltransferase [Anaerolineales bacterium]|nr:GNAT family N-acetyltransferase [Anaerolineales bacterium]
MSPFPRLENSWVVEAMVASTNYIHKAVYQTQYRDLGPIGVSEYGSAPVSPFPLEFLALDEDAYTVAKAIEGYPTQGKKYVVTVFHSKPSAREIKNQYAEYGYEFVRAGPILGYDIPNPARGEALPVTKINTAEQLNRVNQALYLENENIPQETLDDPYIQNFYAEWNGKIAGWAQLITVYPGVGYVHQLYTLMDYRNLRVGSSLMARMHVECLKKGASRMALVSSDMALGLYRRLGYRPLAYFTALRPKEPKPPSESVTLPL